MQLETATEQRQEQSSRTGEALVLLAPVLLLLGLGLSNGGFGLEARHIAGIEAWLIAILILISGRAGRMRRLQPLAWSAGLIAGLAGLSLLSSLWSGSVERSFLEANRVLVYLGVFLAALLLTPTDKLRQRFAEGLVVAVACIVLVGLAGRLLPELITVTGPSAEGARIRFPLGYWNANGAMAGIAVALLLWARRGARLPGARLVAIGLLPSCLLALYFSYSRGGALAGAIALAVLVALSRHRLGHLVLLALAVLATVPAIFAAQSRRAIADFIPGPDLASQGIEVLVILLLGTAALPAAVKGLERLRSRYPQWSRRTVEASREPRVLRAVGIACLVAGALALLVVGERARDQFASPDLQFPERPEAHFGELSGAGRHDFWRVALDEFAENPVLGSGAGTYAFAWREKRSIDLIVQDAHSLYLEAFAELGLVGGLLTLAIVLFLLTQAWLVWKQGAGRERERAAALLAAMLAFAVTAGLDWFWELAALGAVFFCAGGVQVGARCAFDPRDAETDEEPTARRNGIRYGFALAGIAIGWISIALLTGPLIMSFELQRSKRDAAAGNLASAMEHALTARSSQPWAATPYIQLAGLARLSNDNALALEYYHRAADREPDNWQIWLMLADTARAAGLESDADRYMGRASELNPRAPEVQEATDG